MAHAIEALDGAIPHCEACAARAGATDGGDGGVLARGRRAIVGWLARVNGTPVADITRGDLGSIRRLAEA